MEKADLLRQYKEHKKISMSELGRQNQNTRTCQAFYAGDAMDLTGRVSYRDSTGNLRFALCQFNKVKPYVNAARGFLLQTRNKVRFSARSEREMQQFYSEYANHYHDYNRDNCRADQIEARQDLDMLINGYGVTDTFLTFGTGFSSRNPDGEIGMQRLDPTKYWWDPAARETNLIDRKWDGYTKQYYLTEAKELFDAEEDDFERELMEEGNDDFMFNPNGGVKNLIREYYDFADFDEKIINVDFYQYAQIETYYRAYNPIYEQADPAAVQAIDAFFANIKQETQDDMFDARAEILNCSAATKAKIEEVFDIEFKSYKRTCYYSAVISGKKIFTRYKNISQDGFTRKVKTGDFDDKNRIWVGMVNAMIEPQKYFNKSITEFLYTVASVAKGGVMYEKDAIENIRQFEANYLKPDANVEVAEGALQNGKIKPKREQLTQTGVEQIIQLASTSFTDVSGLDPSFLGASDSGLETAALMRQRIKQAANVLACYVDAIILYQKEHARLMLDMMRELASFGGDRQFRLFDADGESELVPVKPDHFVNEYDIDILQAPETEVEKAERMKQLSDIGLVLLQSGDPAGKVIIGVAIDDMNIDPRKKTKVMQALTPQQSIDPMEHEILKAKAAELEGIIQSGQLEKIKSETAKNMADVDKKQAEIVKVLEESKKTAKETDLANVTNVSV